ncbi:GGDEF domain-containing protein [Thiospirochaeta perfilievii]|uniref:diguanylate cyclase n=1 Tax=Thiospirochaeta perfilievii TaxID=252967 RepID=A0A5C1QBK3_9SPIO|nr:GGDEF domain-containing protein [Thiospirochaeta perfilievii]QEN04911.1 GGDEF domain-containing protein [Thiospirochaeta perfilievii]
MEIEDYEKTIYELRQLLEVTKVLNSTLHFKKLVDTILFSFMAQARCVKAALYIGKEIEPDTITLQRNYMGFEITPHVPIQLNCKTPKMEEFARSRKCLTNEEVDKLAYFDVEEINRYIIEQIEIIIPLVINEKIAGLVLLGGRIDSEPIQKSEKEFLSEIGFYASIAIQNSILFDMATMDMMTELKVRHYTTKFIDECIISGDHNFVIIMIDIDDFKRVNDTYGHQTGDDTIIGVSTILKKAIRTNDIASRFGGEEFVIMLRDAALDDAVVVAERIREGVEGLKVISNKDEINVTVSIGLAEFDIDLDKTPEDVISRADGALYISKKTGKNRVTTA